MRTGTLRTSVVCLKKSKKRRYQAERMPVSQPQNGPRAEKSLPPLRASPSAAAHERTLLRYFGFADSPLRSLPATGPGALVTWQWRCRNDAGAMTRGSLFPPPLSAEQALRLADKMSRIVQSVVTTRGSTEDTTVTCGSSHPASVGEDAPAASVLLDRIAASKSGDELSDLRAFRLLDRRFLNSVDGEKNHNTNEVYADHLWRDVSRLWDAGVTAHRQVQRAVSRPSPSSFRSEVDNKNNWEALLPDRVAFLVFYCHTHSTRGTLSAMRAVESQARAYLSAEPQVLRVCTLWIGVSAVVAEDGDGQGTATEARTANQAEDTHFYPSGGSYTLNALLQMLQSLNSASTAVSAADGASGGDATHAAACPLHKRVVVVSESWFVPRSIVAMRSPDGRNDNGGSSSVNPYDFMYRSPLLAPFLTQTGERTRDGSGDDQSSDTVGGGSSTTTVEVFPAVIGNRLSPKEVTAFARYITCRILQ